MEDPQQKIPNSAGISETDGEEEDEENWQEVVAEESTAGAPLQITINPNAKKRRLGVTKEQRVFVRGLHQLHATCLLVSGLRLNQLLDSLDLQAQLLSMLPVQYQTTFDGDKNKDINFTDWLVNLKAMADWWSTSFFKTEPGEYLWDADSSPLPADITDLQIALSDRHGSSLFSILLFLALLRALQLEARLIYAMPCVPYRYSDFMQLQKLRNESAGNGNRENEIPEEAVKTPPKKRQRKAAGKTQANRQSCRYWIEVLCPSTCEWITVDIIRQLFDSPEMMEPRNAILPASYIIAYGSLTTRMKDVSIRYCAANLLSKQKKNRLEEWFSEFLLRWHPNQKLRNKKAEKLENAHFSDLQRRTSMPSTISAFLNHADYVLERHLKKFEYIRPEDKIAENIVGQVRGENILKRSLVHTLHTAEKWLSEEGRIVRPGENPVKFVKSRASNNGRSLNDESKDDDDLDDPRQPPLGQVGVFGIWQTDEYIPPPIINGIIPKNKYGNMDLFLPSMLPQGAAHVKESELMMRAANVPRIPLRGLSLKRIARLSGIDFADAVVGFDYHGGRSIPVTDGIIVASENQDMVEQEFFKKLYELLEKERVQREQQVVERWERLVKRIRIHNRLTKEYR